MRAPEISALFEYLYWIRDQILDAAGRLPVETFLSTDTVTTRDLRATLVHELDVQWSWRERLRTGAFPDEPDLSPDSYTTVFALYEHWRRDEDEMRQWIGTLGDDALGRPPPGAHDDVPLWTYALHIVTHGLQQFSDAAVLLTRAGESPGGIEFLDYANSRRAE